MICTEEKIEKVMASTDEEEVGEEEEKEEEEPVPQSTDKIEEKVLPADQPKEKKEAEVLNLNNEVVRMRKEVKRVRALVLRKMMRQMSALRKKKGKETDLQRNQRRADRLLKEIHALKALRPDEVTKTALRKNLSFELVCKNPESTFSERAIVRIATHPQFSKKIEAIKAAVQAFKEERVKGGKQRGKKGKAQNQAEKATVQPKVSHKGGGGERDDEGEDVEKKEMLDDENDEDIFRDGVSATTDERSEKAAPSAETSTFYSQKKQETKTASTKNTQMKDIVKNPPQSKAAEKKPNLKPAPKLLEKKEDEEESDLDLSLDVEEKEYFDDSTEERFNKQSSQSEDSDDEDDFFLGKVSKVKKKKKKKETKEKKSGAKSDSTDVLKSSNQGQSKLDELESRLSSKPTSLQSVFCSSLSRSKPGGGTQGQGGRGKNKPEGQGKLKGDSHPPRYVPPSEHQKKARKPEGKPGFSSSRHPDSRGRGSAPAGRGRGRGSSDVSRQQDLKRGGVFSQRAPQPALHPSWEASKKRKEQQGQIQAFQGKKIKFEDDD
ncbi:serum response factor-binding protein 1 [Myripristis murdjan]|uniref:Serum response factor-binding protein 1 n=1 Tax=Myripristis murdjan TaxID=586833 RepID=A0A667XS72_9TELE|nr:serum response factor-binding protein 1 [Myripristis murdjan]